MWRSQGKLSGNHAAHGQPHDVNAACPLHVLQQRKRVTCHEARGVLEGVERRCGRVNATVVQGHHLQERQAECVSLCVGVMRVCVVTCVSESDRRWGTNSSNSSLGVMIPITSRICEEVVVCIVLEVDTPTWIVEAYFALCVGVAMDTVLHCNRVFWSNKCPCMCCCWDCQGVQHVNRL